MPFRCREPTYGEEMAARRYAHMRASTADLPVGTFGRLPAHPVTPPFRRTRRLAPAGEILVLTGFAVLLVSLLYLLAA
jgi:hypothetical protein